MRSRRAAPKTALLFCQLQQESTIPSLHLRIRNPLGLSLPVALTIRFKATMTTCCLFGSLLSEFDGRLISLPVNAVIRTTPPCGLRNFLCRYRLFPAFRSSWRVTKSSEIQAIKKKRLSHERRFWLNEGRNLTGQRLAVQFFLDDSHAVERTVHEHEGDEEECARQTDPQI